MAQFFTDFSEYPDGPLADNDWTVRWDDGATYTVVSDAGLEGGKGVQVSDAGDADLIAWDEKDGADIEILVRITETTGDHDSVALRASGPRGERSMYFESQFTDFVAVQKYVDGSFSTVESEAIDRPDDPFYVRLRANGTDLKVKTWDVGASEPDWQVETTDGDLAAGWTGIVGRNVTVVDVFSVGTAGDDAPDEPVAVPVSGTVTMGGEPQEGAVVTVIDDTEAAVAGTARTDENGEYSVGVEAGHIAHAKCQFEDPDTGELFNVESEPFVVANDGE